MSKLTGHSRITKQAVGELNLPQSSFASSHLSVLASAVVGRDLRDVAGGHWADFGQKHHFMRSFNGQSEFDAYIEGINWIKSNALKSARSIRAGKMLVENPHARGR